MCIDHRELVPSYDVWLCSDCFDKDHTVQQLESFHSICFDDTVESEDDD
jgi:hypothetical protein